MRMYMYDALGYINNGLNFEHNQLFNYIIWTSYGEESFLRTQAVTRAEPIKDKIIDCKWVMVAFQEPIEKVSFDYRLEKPTPTKLQVYFPKSAKEIQQYKEINENLGFPYIYTCLADWSNYKGKTHKLYNILALCDRYFTPSSNDFSTYVRWSSDNNGNFLRTCYRCKNKPLKNIDIVGADRVVIVFDRPFDKNLLAFDCMEGKVCETELKMQVIFTYKESVQDEIEWSENLGFNYPYILNLETRKIECIGK